MANPAVISSPAELLSPVPLDNQVARGAVLNWQHGEVPPTHAWIPEDIYRDIIERVPLVCVDTLIVRERHVLLTRRRQEPQAGVLWLQGGRLAKGERLEEAALRIAERESGLELALRAPLGTFSTLFDTSAHGSAATHTVNVTFLAYAQGHVGPRLDHTHEEFVWWPLREPTGNRYLNQLFALARNYLDKEEN